jgi:hypothetical protein
MVSLKNKKKKNKTRRIKGGEVPCSPYNWHYIFTKFNERVTYLILLKDYSTVGFINDNNLFIKLKEQLDNVRFVPNLGNVCEQEYYKGTCDDKTNTYKYLYNKKFTEMNDSEKKEWQTRFYGFLVYIYTEDVLKCIGVADNKDIITQAFLNYFIQLSKLSNLINNNLFGINTITASSTIVTSVLPVYFQITDLLLNPGKESFRKFIEGILGTVTSKFRLKIVNT